MKSILLIIGTFLFFGINTISQPNPEKPNLRQGGYYTESEAVKKHQKFAQTYSDKVSWQKRADKIRATILKGGEIDYKNRKKPDNILIHSKLELSGYKVENVSFQSLEGIYVTGNLYSPLKIKGKIPAILCPHGHGSDPRFKEYTQQRCATLARMGAYVFAYDMIGTGDSKQCIHKIEKAMKLQTYNSIAALDFIETLKNIDLKRIAITGESGGGTQTFILAAIDPRIAVSVPVVMVSGHFFGGCQCESGMQVHVDGDFETSNLQIASTFAPKPMLIISDGADWTKNTPNFEYPYIKNIYRYFGAEKNIENVHLADEKHDYGHNKRLAAYSFLAKHLKLNLKKVQRQGLVDEFANSVLTPQQLAAFNEKYPRPANALQGDEEVMKLLSK